MNRERPSRDGVSAADEHMPRHPQTPPPPPAIGTLRESLTWRGLLLAALTFAAWMAWLGWDHTYYRVPGVSTPQGPYRVWQVQGCVASLAAVALLGGALWRPVRAATVIAVVFTAAWTIDAAITEARAPYGSDGLFGAGAIMIAVGSWVGALALSALSSGVRRSLRR